MNVSYPFRKGLLGFSLIFLTACSGPWNNPNGPEQQDKITYNASYVSQPKHLDPVRAYSSDEGMFTDQIYEPPLQYHYLKRPYELEPMTASAMPSVTYLDEQLQPLEEDAKDPAFSLITIKLKRDILFQPHPAFARNDQGKSLYLFDTAEQSKDYLLLSDFPETDARQLVSDDYIYQMKRMADSANKFPLFGLMSDYIVGMSELSDEIKAAKVKGEWLDLRQFNLEGVERIDELTYTIRIKGIYPQFVYWLAMRFFAPIPWEADRFYHNPGFIDKNLVLDWNPVGTGPFMMVSNQPKREIILERNPNYREDYYPSEGSEDDRARGFLKDAGKRMPFIDRAVYRMDSATPQWAKFMQGYYDRSGEDSSNVNSATFDQAFTVGPDGLDLTPELIANNIQVDEEIRPSINYTAFNMRDPVVGGYTEDRQKLRQAISIAWDDQEYVDIFENGLGKAAHGPVPPGLYGYREGQAGMNPYVYDWNETTGRAERKSLDYARRLLSEAGYPNGRHKETGEPLILYLDTTSRDNSPSSDWMRRQLQKLGIQLEFRVTDFSRFKEKIRQGNTQIFKWGWLADYPDPENFLFLLDSRQGSLKCQCDGSNYINYDRADYDALYDKVKTLTNGPERLAAIHDMVAMVQKDAPWIWGYNVKDYFLANQWLSNTKRHGISYSTLKYVRVDPAMRSQYQQAWNQPNLVPLAGTLLALIGLMIPVMGAFRRRQKLTIETDD
ncbi:ABC transporter substrate-binding protein [Endozoicomonas arenosclerae]|uniref:ABC transporter substrate-binding protein n=1 Tax=Endozoicomonas arenosclerae TaxID=1633495 RepID=UPI0007817BC6|nr:ABC transporter substrate-binding protein [Endozoicomonas arenosclerae]